MARLEFSANGHQVVVEGVEPHQVSTVVASLVATFDGIAQAAQPEPRKVRDVYYIQSNSRVGYKHRVAHYGNGIFECDCEGYKHRGYCRHTTEALSKHRQAYGYRG